MPASVRAMSFHALLAIALVALSLVACRTTKKSKASIYEGDGPTIHYHEAESAGGRVRTKHYR